MHLLSRHITKKGESLGTNISTFDVSVSSMMGLVTQESHFQCICRKTLT